MSIMNTNHAMFVDNPNVVARRGLGAVGQKLSAGDDVTVVFFGGSITWGGQASDIEQTSYRAQTTQWLREQYPNAKITSINAGIGGTGSNLGVFRCASDVLVYQPDMVFVEFAVNDGGMDDIKSMETFEGILRQLLSAVNVPDICIVYTIAKQHLEIWNAGGLSPRAGTQERVAEYYNLPSVRMARGIADKVCNGVSTWEEQMSDHVHPLDAGHTTYTQVLTTSLEKMFKLEPVVGHVLPVPMISDRYVTSRMQDLPHVVDGWTWIDLENKGGWECFNGLLMTEIPGTQLTMNFTGKIVGLYFQLGPDTGNLYYRIDDGPEQLLEPFDKWAPTCTRPQYRVLNDELVDGKHTIHIRVAESRDKDSNGTWTRLAYLMVG